MTFHFPSEKLILPYFFHPQHGRHSWLWFSHLLKHNPLKGQHIGGIGSAKCHITKRKIYRTGTENTTILTKFWSRSRFFALISSMQWQTMLWNVTMVREGCEKYWWWQIWNDFQRNPKWPDWCISGQMEDDIQKSDSYGLKSERPTSTWSLACVSTNLDAFCPMGVHLPSEKLILPYFSGPRGVAILVSRRYHYSLESHQ